MDRERPGRTDAPGTGCSGVGNRPTPRRRSESPVPRSACRPLSARGYPDGRNDRVTRGASGRRTDGGVALTGDRWRNRGYRTLSTMRISTPENTRLSGTPQISLDPRYSNLPVTSTIMYHSSALNSLRLFSTCRRSDLGRSANRSSRSQFSLGHFISRLLSSTFPAIIVPQF